MYLLWKKISQKSLKVAKYNAKVTLVSRHADGRGRLRRLTTNKWTYGKHWRLSVGVSTVSRAYRTSRTKRVERGEIFQLIDCWWFHFLGGLKKVYGDNNNNNKNKNVSPNVLGRMSQVKSMCGKHWDILCCVPSVWCVCTCPPCRCSFGYFKLNTGCQDGPLCKNGNACVN